VSNPLDWRAAPRKRSLNWLIPSITLHKICGDKTATVWIQIIGVKADFDEVSSGNGEVPETSAVPEGSCLENWVFKIFHLI